jgi:GT2 family glycosyltransferase
MTPNSSRDVTIITVNYHSSALIHDMEARVAELGGCELIVADNSGEFVASRASTRVIDCKENLGFGRACNLAARQTRSARLLFLNPDVGLDVDALARFLDDPRSDGRSIVGPAIIDGAGRVPTIRRGGRFGLSYRRLALPIESLAHDAALPVLYVSGACMLLSKALFDELNGFCEDIFLYAEDLELCIRAAQAGTPIAMLTGVRINHAGGRSSAVLRARLMRLSRSYRGHFRFLAPRSNPVRAAVDALHLASGIRL